jgi:exosortase
MDTQEANGILEEFRLEFLKSWNRLPNKGPFLILLVAWVVFFQFLGNSTLGYFPSPSLFRYVYNAIGGGTISLMQSEEGYVALIPLVVAVLFWRKREELLALNLRCWWPGFGILAAGTLLHILGYAVQQPRISVVGFFVGIYGLMGLFWGLAWLRSAFFPFFLFGFCVPIGTLAEPITFRLRLLVSALVGFVSHYVLAIDVIIQGNQLIDPTGHYQYEIAAACSGIRSLIATFAFAVILSFVSFQSFWKRLVLIASAFPLAVLGNLVRMLTIIIAAEIGGQQWGTYIHDGGPGDVFSLLPYVPAFIGLLTLEHYLRASGDAQPGSTVGHLKLKET